MSGFHTIRAKLLFSYLLLTLIIILLLDSIIFWGVKEYYYNNIGQFLKREAQLTGSFYNDYLSGADIKDIPTDILYNTNSISSPQVQIIDATGIVTYDSSISTIGTTIDYPDVKNALLGRSDEWTGKDKITREPVMSASYPLRSKEQVIGAIRFTSSLNGANSSIRKITMILFLLGIAILIVSMIIGQFMSNNITKPLRSITSTAQNMASGNFEIHTDIKNHDEIGELARTLNFMADEIIYHEKLKNDFTSSITHELKTPLTSIIGWTLTLNTGDLEDKSEIKEGLEIIQEECYRLDNLLNDLLDFSKYENGKEEYHLSQNDPIVLLEYIRKYMTPRANRQNIIFNVSYENPLPLVEYDYNRIVQVLINIIDNSLKYTPPGKNIYLSGEKADNSLILKVSDEGCGIQPQDLPRIMDKYFKGANSKGGNGIGLSICKRIIEAHKGSINISSNPGKGTVVTVKLPL